MKDSKRIDNKAKSRRIAAYALAGCMAVTAAPITMPGMGAEVVKAANFELAASTAITLDSDCTVKYSTTFAEVASKIKINATQGSNTGVWSNKATSVTITDGKGNLVWNSSGDTSTPGTTKFGYGKTYTITATYTRTAALASGVTESTLGDTSADGSATELSGASKTSVVFTKTVVFYPTSGILSDEKVNASGVYDGSGKYRLMYDNSGTISQLTGKAGVYKNSSGWWLVDDNGNATTAIDNSNRPVESIEKNDKGLWYVDANGKVDFTKTGLFDAADESGSGDDTGKTITGIDTGKYYVVNGKVDTSKTGIVSKDGKWYNVVRGIATAPNESTVLKGTDGKWYYIDSATGESDDTFEGIAKNTNGTWYVNAGVVDFSYDGILDINRGDNTTTAPNTKVLVLGGKVQTDTTGIVFFEGKPYYVSKGIVSDAEFDKKSLVKDVKTGTWYVLDEQGHTMLESTLGANDGYCGLISNQYGTWHVVNGIVDFDSEGFVYVNDDNDDVGAGSSATAGYYVDGGKVQTGKNGVVVARNGWQIAHVKAGKVTGLEINNSVVKASNGKWYAIDKDGQLARNAIGGNANGIWASNGFGVVDFKESGFHTVTEDEAKLKGLKEDDVAYFKDGKLQSDFTGVMKVGTGYTIVDAIPSTDMVSIKNGVVSETVSVKGPTVIKATDGKWYYVDADGKLDGTYNGIATNSNGTWYVSRGKVNFNKTGLVVDADADKTYYFVNSKLATDKTGLVKIFDNTDPTPSNRKDKIFYVEKGVVTAKKTNDNVVKMDNGVWYYVGNDGIVNTGFTGLAENKNGVWYIKNGRVDFSKTGVVPTTVAASDKVEKFQAGNLYVVNGKVQFDYTGLAIDDSGNPVYFEKGQEARNETPTVVKATDGQWYYVEDGAVNTRYTGLAKNSNGIWYIYNGKVSFSKTGIIETDAVEGTKLEAGEYYVANGKMTSDKDGIVSSNGSEYYVQKSAVVKDTELDQSVIKVGDTWYCVLANGKVGQPQNGVAANKNGIWYINEKGRVDFKKTGLVDITSGNTIINKAVGEKVYIAGGKFQEDSTCVVVDKDRDLKLYVNNGITTTTKTSKLTKNIAVKGTDGKMYGVKFEDGNGLLDPSSGYHALAATEDGVVCVGEDGVVVTKVTPQIVKIESTDSASRALLRDPATPAKDENIVIIDGKYAKDTTGVVKVGTNRVYVVKGICTAAKDVHTNDTLVKDSDGTLYYTGNASYTVDSSAPEIIGKYDDAEYYVVYGKVKKVKLTAHTVGEHKYNVSATTGIATDVCDPSH